MMVVKMKERIKKLNVFHITTYTQCTTERIPYITTLRSVDRDYNYLLTET